MMMRLITYSICFVFGTQLSIAQHQLDIKISGVESTEGAIAIALYTNAKDFLDFEKAVRFKRIPAKEEPGYSFENLTTGYYAVAVFYDKNSNDRLDTNFIGIPKEALGTSGIPKNKMGPPRFKNCKFYLEADKSIEISVKKLFK